MRRIKLLSTVFLSVLVMTVFFVFDIFINKVNADETDDAKRVLFISSYSYAWPSVRAQIKGLDAGLPADVTVDYEFMDTKNHTDSDNIKHFYSYLKYKLNTCEQYDIIIVGDDAALIFAVEHQEELFKDIPIIFLGVNDTTYAYSVSTDPLISGVVEKLSFNNNIDFALKLNPNAKNVVAILDDTVTGVAERKSFYSHETDYPDLHFVEINTSILSREQIVDSVSTIDENSILLFIVMTEDMTGHKYTEEEAITLVTENSKVPVMRMVSGGLDYGLLGGYVVSMEESGNIAATMATGILNGRSSAIYGIKDSPNNYVVNEAVFEKYDISKKLIPKDAVVYNHRESFWSKYKALLPPIIILMIAMCAALVLTVRYALKHKKINNNLSASTSALEHSSLYDFLTEIPNRTKLYADLSNMLAHNSICTLYIFDLDGFKQINDTYGHNMGDEVLKEVGRRLSSITNKNFTPYRLAGDEFICILNNNFKNDMEEYAKKCINLFKEPFCIGDIQIDAKVSLGIAAFPDDANDMVKLIEHADRAMYTVKKNGKNSYAYYRNLSEEYK